jgi:signal transduction histidine kinase
MVSIRKSKQKINNINKILKQKNHQLEHLNQDLNKLNKTKNKFFSIIAHDLRGPIGSTSQLLTQLEENFDSIDKETQLGIISSLKKTGIHTFNLLENLLDWAKTQKSEFKNNPEEFDLFEVVDEVFNILNSKAINKNQHLINLIEKQKYFVYSDRKMLTAILINLLNNSIKFSEIGKRIFVKARKINSQIELLIEDEGVGIPDEFKESLFDLPIGHSATGTQNEKGTGLGLILIHEFAKIMNTEINLVKSDKNGTVFSIKLNLSK